MNALKKLQNLLPGSDHKMFHFYNYIWTVLLFFHKNATSITWNADSCNNRMFWMINEIVSRYFRLQCSKIWCLSVHNIAFIALWHHLKFQAVLPDICRIIASSCIPLILTQHGRGTWHLLGIFSDVFSMLLQKCYPSIFDLFHFSLGETNDLRSWRLAFLGRRDSDRVQEDAGYEEEKVITREWWARARDLMVNTVGKLTILCFKWCWADGWDMITDCEGDTEIEIEMMSGIWSQLVKGLLK